MIKRALSPPVQKALAAFPVVGLLGPRQVGKTTLAKELCKTFRRAHYLDLELPSDAAKLAEAELYLAHYDDRLVIIDEVQRLPGLFPLLRALVDKKRRPGRFLLLGSASPDMVRHASESLAGRIRYFELSPFTLHEVGADAPARQTLWLRGGYPLSYLAESPAASLSWRNAFIATYLERDLPQLGVHIPALVLRKFWTMVAHCHGQLWNGARLAASLGVSSPTVRHYLDILTETYIVRQLAPYYGNLKKRLVKSPKIYLRDTGLLHALLGVPAWDDLQAHPHVGSSWEGFVIEQVLALLPEMGTAYFYRTSSGTEVDLLVFPFPEKPVAIEVKYSADPRPAAGFWHAFKDVGASVGYVIYPGEERYPLGEKVWALPLSALPRIFN